VRSRLEGSIGTIAGRASACAVSGFGVGGFCGGLAGMGGAELARAGGALSAGFWAAGAGTTGAFGGAVGGAFSVGCGGLAWDA
jgi:hypothetical protein